MEEELLMKWEEISNKIVDKEVKLEAFVQNWLDGNSSLSSNSIEQLIDTTTTQIEELKRMEQTIRNEYFKVCRENALRKQGLRAAKTSVIKEFGTNPDEMIITGGVLSTKADETHLIGRTKTQEELEQERQEALAEIRYRVATKQITLAEASKLKSDVNLVYGYSSENEIQR